MADLNLMSPDRSTFLNSLRTSRSSNNMSHVTSSHTSTFGNFAQQQQFQTQPQQQQQIDLLNQMRLQNLKLQEQILLQQFQAQQAFEQLHYQQQMQQLGRGRSGQPRDRSATDSVLSSLQSPSFARNSFGQSQEEFSERKSREQMLRLQLSEPQSLDQGHSQIAASGLTQSAFVTSPVQSPSSPSSRLPFLSTRAGDGGVQAGHILAAHALARKGKQSLPTTLSSPIASVSAEEQFQSFSSFGPQSVTASQPTPYAGGPNNIMRAGHHRRSSSTNSFLSAGSHGSNGIVTPALILSRPGEEWPTSPVSHMEEKKISARLTVRTRTPSITSQLPNEVNEDNVPQAQSRKAGHKHSNSKESNYSSSEESVSSEKRVGNVASGASSTNTSSFESLNEEFQSKAGTFQAGMMAEEDHEVESPGSVRPNLAKGLTAALSGAGTRQRPVSWGNGIPQSMILNLQTDPTSSVQAQGMVMGLSSPVSPNMNMGMMSMGMLVNPMSPFATTFNPASTPFSPSATQFTPKVQQYVPPQQQRQAPAPQPTEKRAPIILQSNRQESNVTTVFVIRQPRGPAEESELPLKNFAARSGGAGARVAETTTMAAVSGRKMSIPGTGSVAPDRAAPLTLRSPSPKLNRVPSTPISMTSPTSCVSSTPLSSSSGGRRVNNTGKRTPSPPGSFGSGGMTSWRSKMKVNTNVGEGRSDSRFF